MHVDTVKNTLFLGKVCGCEREASRNSAGVHVTANLKLVSTLRHSTVHALLLLRGGYLTEDHLLAKDGFDLVLNKLELVERIGINCDIEAVAEEFFCADLELIAKFLSIGDSGFELWVTNFAFFTVDIGASFELGNLLLEVLHNNTSIDWVNVHGNIDNFIDINNRA